MIICLHKPSFSLNVGSTSNLFWKAYFAGRQNLICSYINKSLINLMQSSILHNSRAKEPGKEEPLIPTPQSERKQSLHGWMSSLGHFLSSQPHAVLICGRCIRSQVFSGLELPKDTQSRERVRHLVLSSSSPIWFPQGHFILGVLSCSLLCLAVI